MAHDVPTQTHYPQRERQSGTPRKADNENGIMEKATNIMDYNRSKQPTQDRESSQPNHRLADTVIH